MLVSASLLENYILSVGLHNKVVTDVKQEGGNVVDYLKQGRALSWMVGVSLSGQTQPSWSFYIHQQANLVLCIPHKYLSKHFASAATQDEQIVLAGFKVGVGSEWISVDRLNPLESIGKLNIDADIVAPLTSCLNPHYQWKILIMGHGDSAALQSRAHEYEEQMSQMRTFRTQTAHLSHNPFFKRQLRYSDLLIKSLQQKINVLKTSQSPLASTAEIAGLPFNNFIRLLERLNKMNTFHVHYKSCRASGYNRALVQQALNFINPKFIISLHGGCDRAIADRLCIEGETSFTAKQDFAAFFDTWDILFNSYTGPRNYNALLGRTLAHLHPTYHGNVHHPCYGYVYDPGAKDFTPLSYGYDAAFVTAPIAAQERPIIIIAKDAVVINVHQVNAPLYLQHNCPIFCEARTVKEVREKRDSDICDFAAEPTVSVQFKEIQTTATLKEFILALFKPCAQYPHQFSIDKLGYREHGNHIQITGCTFSSKYCDQLVRLYGEFTRGTKRYRFLAQGQFADGPDNIQICSDQLDPEEMPSS